MLRTKPTTARSTRRRDTPPPIPTALAGLAVVVLLAVLGWQALRVYNGVPLRNYSTVYVSTPQVGNLLSHDPVRVAGARVGQVIGRDVGPDGNPRIKLQIEPGTDLPADTKVAVRGAGLLGARYVELVPGQSTKQIAEDATIRGTDDSYTYGLPETLDTFDAETRGGLRNMLGGLGQGFLANGEKLNDSITAVATRAAPFGAFAREVLKREGAPGRLIPALDSALAPLDANRDRLARLSGVAADAVNPFIAQRDALRRTLDAAPPALGALSAGLPQGTRLLASVDRAATAANRTLTGAPAGLRSLTRLLAAGRPALDRAQPLLKAVQPAVPGALRITDAAKPVLKPLKAFLADTVAPLAEVKRYGCDIINFGATMRSMTGYTQPGSGPNGPAQAFRLQVVLPVSLDAIGARDIVGDKTRDQQATPCKYLSKPYPQFTGGR